MFDLFFIQATVTDINDDVNSVNATIALPNGSIVTYVMSNTSTIYNTTNLTATNGTYYYNITTDDGTTSPDHDFIVTDTQLISPQNYTSIVQAGYNYTFNITIDTGTNTTLLYNLTCQTSHANLTCYVPVNTNVTNSTTLQINITTTPTLPNGSYTGNITVKRVTDSKNTTINLFLGVSSSGTIGQPYIMSKYDWTVSTTITGVVSTSYLVNNTGNYTLSNCNGSIGGDFTTTDFYSFNLTNFTITANEARNISVTYTFPDAGTYRGYLQIICVATSDGLLNSLTTDNQPYLQLISTSPAIPPSGGGGAGAQCGNGVCESSETNITCPKDCIGVTWTITRESATIQVVPGTCVVKDFVIENIEPFQLNMKITSASLDGSNEWISFYTDDNISSNEINVVVPSGVESLHGQKQFFVKVCVPANQALKFCQSEVSTNIGGSNSKILPIGILVASSPPITQILEQFGMLLITPLVNIFPEEFEWIDIIFTIAFWVLVATVIWIAWMFTRKPQTRRKQF